MLTVGSQIKAVTAAVGRPWSEQCGFQWLNGSTTRGRSYRRPSTDIAAMRGPLKSYHKGRFSCAALVMMC